MKGWDLSKKIMDYLHLEGGLEQTWPEQQEHIFSLIKRAYGGK